jgi:hypothetical protein
MEHSFVLHEVTVRARPDDNVLLELWKSEGMRCIGLEAKPTKYTLNLILLSLTYQGISEVNPVSCTTTSMAGTFRSRKLVYSKRLRTASKYTSIMQAIFQRDISSVIVSRA